MLAAGRYLYVLFCCQQAVEKSIKGLIARQTGEMPPRLHNLMVLAGKANLEAGESRAEQLRSLTAYYVQTRYPEEIKRISASLDRRLATDALRFTEELLEWLSTLTK